MNNMKFIMESWRNKALLSEAAPTTPAPTAPQTQPQQMSQTALQFNVFKIVAGMIMDVIQKNNIPKILEYFILQKSAYKDQKDTDYSGFLLATPQMKQKILPIMQSGGGNVDKYYDQIISLFSEKTNQEYSEKAKYIQAIMTFTTSTDQKSISLVLQGNSPQSKVVRPIYKAATDLLNRAKSGDKNAISEVEKYTDLGGVQVVSDAKVSSVLTDRSRQDKNMYTQNVEEYSLQLVNSTIVRKG